MRGALSAGLALLTPIAADAQQAPLLTGRAEMLVTVANGSGDLEAIFTPAFLQAVPEAQIRALFAQLTGKLGKATGIGKLTPQTATSATLTMTFEKGTATMAMVLTPDAAGQIAGLRITATDLAQVARLQTLDAVAAAFRQLPGQSGFIVSRIDGGSNGPLVSVEPDRPLAIGSTFKLVILAELVRATGAGERGWNDLVTIDGAELPAGGFRTIPAGSQVPLRALAEAMIRVSDNSATDILLHTLGRDRVEAMQHTLGLRAAPANTPFLSTMEAFKLKGVEQGALGRRYLALDAAGRRALLDGEVAKTPGSAVGPLFADGQPVMIDRIEWFASPADLVRAMGWLHDRRGTPAGDEALRILALNPGPAAGMADRWAYAGFKGGSEPGVVSMTLLLRDKAERWTVISASWNDPEKPVDDLLFGGLVKRAAELAAN